MDVKIGIADTGRELSLDIASDAQELRKQVDATIADGAPLSLTDAKGRQVIVPADKVAYVEIGPADSRRVGFAVGE